jgi:hypothetical protein
MLPRCVPFREILSEKVGGKVKLYLKGSLRSPHTLSPKYIPFFIVGLCTHVVGWRDMSAQQGWWRQ